MTFDSFCCGNRPEVRFTADTWQGPPLLSPTLFVMEIKFDHAIPTWIREIAVAHGLKPQRFSEYATAIQALAMAAPIAPRGPLAEPPEPKVQSRAEDPKAQPDEGAERHEEPVAVGAGS